MKIKVVTLKSIASAAIINKMNFRNYRNILTGFSAFCLAVVGMPNHLIPSEIDIHTILFAQSSGSNYGLGFPKTASTGGGTRLVNPEEGRLRGGRSYSRNRNPMPSVPPAPSSSPEKKRPQLPLLTLITPEDGGRTASSQPVLYWYVYAPNTDQDMIGQMTVTTGDSDAIAIFQADLKIHHGLSRFKLPIAAALKPAQPYRWQIKLEDSEEEDVIASGWIVYTPPNENLRKSLLRALTNRDHAKIYAQAGYWFEAIDGYTQWLNFKPNDLDARAARNQILNLGFATNTNLDFETFKKVLNANAPIE